MALVVEALVDAGVKEGLTARQATQLALGTMAGSAELLRSRGGDTVSVKREVTSPGGSHRRGPCGTRGARAARGLHGRRSCGRAEGGGGTEPAGRRERR